MKRLPLLLYFWITMVTLGLQPAHGEDWPMWGGGPGRNMVSTERGLPHQWKESEPGNIRWTAALGTQTFSNPVVGSGRVFIGTNNGKPRNPEIQGDRGVLMCFAEKDGTFLWQAIHDKLETGDAEDWAEIGICSTPCVQGDRVYYVSNRAELVACDVEGFADGENDGPFQSETRKGKEDADFVWMLDLRKELGVVPYQASASSPLVVGDTVFVLTGHGVDEKTHEVKDPDVPSFIAVDCRTGRLIWKDHSPGKGILEGQWGSPAYGVVDGKPQVAFPGGDGWIYAFEPKSGKPMWKFNCKAHEKGTTRNQLVATPVYSGNRLVIALGQNPEAGGGPGCLRAIDASGSGDVSAKAEAWRLEGKDFGGSISNVAVHEGLVYAAELDGFLGCIELETGKRVWRHDLLAYIWGSPLVADGKVYVRNGDGDVVVMRTGRKKEVLSTGTLPGLFHGTPVAANGVLYLAGEDRLYALANDDG